jgi:hypothetical protein
MRGNAFFRIEILPAYHGDCIWIEYGKGSEVNRILIDGGTVAAYENLKERIQRMPENDRVFELIVLTHVDADHVEGLVRLFAEKPLPIIVDQVWFNGWNQMEPSDDSLGPLQGEFLSSLLVKRVHEAWNPNARALMVSENGRLPEYGLPGGMTLTLLSPDAGKIEKMAKAWRSAVQKAGIGPGDLEGAWKALASRRQFLPKEGLLGADNEMNKLLERQFMRDQAAPNGSSIAFLAEYAGKSALFLADAHPDIVLRSIKRLCKERGIEKLPVNAVKVSHHGSRGNTSEALLKAIQCPAYLISTNGDKFKHPDKECIVRILRFGKPKQLLFNYRSTYTKPWLAAPIQREHEYEAIVREDDALSLEVLL